jgi:hypothetical protein
MTAKTKLSYFLKLDFDVLEPEYLKLIERIKTIFNIIGFLKLESVRVMQTKKGFHTYLTVSPKGKLQIMPMDMVALQAILGSDYKREAFNFNRVKSGVNLRGNAWNVLFNSKWKTNNGELLSSEVERKDLEEKLGTTLV